jgi:hypothetical protein
LGAVSGADAACPDFAITGRRLGRLVNHAKPPTSLPLRLCQCTAPIYGWLIEGFDTPTLQYAKALLDELAIQYRRSAPDAL